MGIQSTLALIKLGKYSSYVLTKSCPFIMDEEGKIAS